MNAPFSIRGADVRDMPFLARMLAFAASMDDDAKGLATVRSDPSLRSYLDDFGRAGDLGVVAERGADPIGAAWLRLLHGEPSPAKLWTQEVPELAIATVREVRGLGVGEAMLRALIERARGGYP